MERSGRALLVFLDGVGIGPGDPRVNPFAAARLPRLGALLGAALVSESLGPDDTLDGPGAVVSAADATLGMDGLPQSGTGQTALLTGTDAVAAYGRHFGPWVPTPLRPMLAARSVLARAREAGLRVAFANAYPLGETARDARTFRRPAAPPLAADAVGALTRGAVALAAGDAVASSITSERWRELLGDAIPDVTAAEAARNLARISAGAELTLFAHYDTDYRGHRGGMDGAAAALERVDAFLGALVDALPGDALLVVSSDHGNIEDVTAGHTRNPVPVLAAGAGRRAFLGARSILDVAPLLLAALGVAPDHPYHDPP